MFQPRLFKLRCGGGLYVVSGSPEVSNSTIAANGASPSGGNIFTSGTVTIHNRSVAQQLSGQPLWHNRGGLQPEQQ